MYFSICILLCDSHSPDEALFDILRKNKVTIKRIVITEDTLIIFPPFFVFLYQLFYQYFVFLSPNILIHIKVEQSSNTCADEKKLYWVNQKIKGMSNILQTI
jgi:hypothetical protein